jgi:hypothetical protein
MKTAFTLIAAGLVTLAFASPSPAASLLGGLIKTGPDSGNGSGLITSNGDGGVGVGGTNGVSVNLGDGLGGLGGGGGGLGGVLGGGGSTGVPGVAEVSASQTSGGGTKAGVSLLGGGNDLKLNPLGLLGNGGSLTASLPGLGGLGGTGGTPGAPGTPGINGSNGFNGFGGINGYNGVKGSSGVYIPSNVSSRLRSILAMLAARDWIRLVNGRAICLGRFGSAEISSILPRRDWAGFNAALPQYAQDIATLRQLLANCMSPQQRQALNLRDLNRVVGIDLGRNGTPVVYFL